MKYQNLQNKYYSQMTDIYCSGQNIKTILEILQQALNILLNWLNKTGQIK